MPPARRTRRVGRSTLWTAVCAALVAHGAILGTVQALGMSMIGDGLHARTTPRRPVADDDELAASCFNDVVFATSGRAALCLAPWIADVDACLADAQMALWMDLSSCSARNEPTTAIAMLEPKTAEKLKPIDAERLLEDTKRDAKPPPPPPIPPPTPADVPPPPPPPPPAPARPQQIIETVKPNSEKEPENARFLSEFNTKVEKEKVARGARNEPMVAKSKPEELTAKLKPKDEPAMPKPPDPERVAGKNEHAPDVPGHLSMRNPGAESPAETEQDARVRGSATGAGGAMVADGYLTRKGDGSIEQQRRERTEIPRGQSGAGGGTPQVPNLKLSDESLERTVGGGSVDHLEDVDNGDETSLSSKRWIHASFFNRIKRQVAQNWDPGTVWRHSDPTGTVYGFKTRITEVRVSLTRKGEVAKIVVTGPSGVSQLDDEALRAFKSAGPFPNPPEALVQKDNLITFGFSFFFEIGAPHLSWRLPQSM